MANLLSDFLKSIAKRTGLELTDDHKDFMDKVKDLEIPEDIQASLQSGLMTADEAKENKDVSDHFQTKFKGQYLNDADRSIDKSLKSPLFRDKADVIEKISGEKDTVKKLKLFHNALDTLKIEKGDNEDIEKLKKDYQKNLDELNQQLSTATETHTRELEEKNQSITSERLQMRLRSKLNNFEYQEHFTPEQLDILLMNDIKNAPYDIKLDNGEIKLFKKGSDLQATDKSNKKVKEQDFLEALAAPYLKKSDTDPDPNKPVVKGTTEGGDKPVGARGAAAKAAQEADAGTREANK